MANHAGVPAGKKGKSMKLPLQTLSINPLRRRAGGAMLAALALGTAPGVLHARDPVPEDVAPESASGYTEKQAVHARRFMAATANPHATRAAQEMLRAGGSAFDAAAAGAIMLTLTEPQSSGLGGGSFVNYYDAAAKKVRVYDGREAAPAAARPDRFMGANGRPVPLFEAINSGKAVGVPGLLRVLEMAHRNHGRLPWAKLFEPTIRLAEAGFQVSPRLAKHIAEDRTLKSNVAARAYFYNADGSPRAVGYLLRNPVLADTLRRIAAGGANAFYEGAIARDIVQAVAGHPKPGDMSEADLSGYMARERQPVCGNYRSYRLCGMPPPSSGGTGVLAILGMLERFDMAAVRPGSTEAVHLFSEAARLAYADRDYYVGDPDFVGVPVAGMIDPDYLKSRSALIRREQTMGRAEPGRPRGVAAALGADHTEEVSGTSHISVIDAAGNAVAMTTTIESQFGSRIMVRGFMLNNQMTDFSFQPTDAGQPVANAVGAGKRPRSSMSPTLVFDANGRLVMTVGSPGGSAIINYVAKTLVGVLDWKMDVQSAISMPNMGSRNRATEIEKGTALEALSGPLKALGHDVSVIDFTSGLQGIVITPGGLVGGADPRREGLVLGD